MDFVKKIMIISTAIMTTTLVIFLSVVPHTEENKAWRESMSMQDCNHLATYLIGAKNTPNYTQIASDNVQFIYNTYQDKNCTKELGWSP